MESSLALKLSDLESEVGFFLGYGRGTNASESAWTTEQQNQITAVVKKGLRRFYYPTPINGLMYDWSFLRPVATLTLHSGATTVALPDDFGSPEDVITVSNSSQDILGPLRLTNEARIRQQYVEWPGATGRPQLAAQQPLKNTSSTGQRFQLAIWPAADQDYTLQLSYYILPDYPVELRPYPYGGAAHAETILESCLAAAEETIDDSPGTHAGAFMARLMASINFDRKNKPQNLGYNGDRSDARDWYPKENENYWNSTITVNGVQY